MKSHSFDIFNVNKTFFFFKHYAKYFLIINLWRGREYTTEKKMCNNYSENEYGVDPFSQSYIQQKTEDCTQHILLTVA